MMIFITVFSIVIQCALAQKTGVPNVITFTNSIIPNILHALSFEYENAVFSPFGLSTSLAMILEGVDNKLGTEMTNTLNLEGPSVVKPLLRAGFKSLLEEFEREKDAQDSAGSYNSAYLHSAKPLLVEYKAILETFYRAAVTHNTTSLDNTELLLDIHTDSGVMSHWKDFDKLAVYTYLTHEPSAPFITENITVNVPMIPQVGTFRAGYIKRLKSQAIELQLETKRASLFLIMPDRPSEMRDVLAKMLKENLAVLPSTLPLIETEVSLPQFVILNNNLNLSKIMERLGLRGIFATKTSAGPVKSITQNAYFATSFVSVNSVGSTNTKVSKNVSIKKQKRQVSNAMVFNRPFIFFLLHKPTGVALLAGIVRTPSQIPQ